MCAALSFTKKPVIQNRKLTKLVTPTQIEIRMAPDELIVSKTDLTGRITYVNDVFLKFARFKEHEMIGAPHSVIRHPDMPRAVFKLLWDILNAKQEIFAYVKNMSANGDHYWVLAHVTPSFDATGAVAGYHSNRRCPERRTLEETIIPLYTAILAEEKKYQDRKSALEKSFAMLVDVVKSKGMSYDELILSL